MRFPAQQYWDHIFLLNLSKCADEPLDNLKIQKIAFISENEARKKKLKAAHFPFFRYTYGSFSREVANDVRKLEDLGFLHPETREPTERAKYLLDYTEEFVKKSKAAQSSLRIVAHICRKYRGVKSTKLVDIVYKMKVPVAQFQDRIMLVRDIPLRADIIRPDSDLLPDFSIFPQQAIEDLRAEFALSAEDLNPVNPDNIAFARAALDAALAR